MMLRNRHSELTYERARSIREGIVLSRRNYEHDLEIAYDAQVPQGSRVRAIAYHRTWMRSVMGELYRPPRRSSTRRNFRPHDWTENARRRMDEFANSAGLKPIC